MTVKVLRARRGTGGEARSAMQVSLAGLLVCGALLLVAYYSRGMLIVALAASQVFGATAVVTLSFVGGSSPLIYTVFAGLLVAAVAPNAWEAARATISMPLL
jgi:hypothetical protein